jgi:hypothetical protein
MTATTAKGGCLCGGVRYSAEVTAQMSVCHCDVCRRWAGGPMMAVHPTSPAAVEGDTLTWFRSSDWAERGFCNRCGASMFYRLVEDRENIIIAAGGFDDPAVFKGFNREIFIDEKPEFYAFTGDRPRLTGAEALAEFTAEYYGDSTGSLEQSA